MRRPEVRWELDRDLARHELLEVLQLLRDGETDLPEHYARSAAETG